MRTGKVPRGDAIKQEAWDWIEATQSRYHRISDAIWSFAELPMQESLSSSLLTRILEGAGFKVQRGTAGMPTAFVASSARGGSGPTIGILAEYDALPSLSQWAGVARHRPVVDDAPGHGCTHCAMGTVSIFTAIALKDSMDRYGLEGEIKVFGCPGEEALVSRPYMVREGLFGGLDAVFDVHGSDSLRAEAGTMNSALHSFVVSFAGRSAHAASAPWHGLGALHAVEIMNASVNALREHMHYAARIHYTIVDGGRSPNVIPDRASVWYYVRDSDERVGEDVQKVLRCAEGASVATGAAHSVQTLTAVHQNYHNRALAGCMDKNVKAVGMPIWSDADAEYARAIQRENGLKRGGLRAAANATRIHAAKAFVGGGSSDVGEVTLVAPTARLLFPALPKDLRSHHWMTTSSSATPIAHKGITAAVKVLVATGIDLVLDKVARRRIADEFARLKKAHPYRSYLPKDTSPPIDLNREIMSDMRPAMERHYYDPESSRPLMTEYGIDA